VPYLTTGLDVGVETWWSSLAREFGAEYGVIDWVVDAFFSWNCVHAIRVLGLGFPNLLLLLLLLIIVVIIVGNEELWIL